MNDLLAPERAIVDRLNKRMSDVAVRRSSSLPELLQTDKPQSNTIYIVFGGGNVQPRGSSSVLDLRWVAVVAARNVGDVRGGSKARDDAGPLCARVIQALQNWTPCAGFSALLLVATEAPVLVDSYFLYPLVFATTTIF